MRFLLIAGCMSLAVLAAAENGAPEPQQALITSVVRLDPQTGRLVRSLTPPTGAARKLATTTWADAASIERHVRETAERYQVDPLLVRSVIQVESNSDPFAISPKGAQGLMQLMPETARRFSVGNSFNPWQNIEGGVRYLKYLLTLFGGAEAPEALALAAYNAGEGAVMKHGGVPPYRETTEYVRKVAKKWDEARSAAGLTAQPPHKTEAAAPPRIEQFTDAQGVLHVRTLTSP